MAHGSDERGRDGPPSGSARDPSYGTEREAEQGPPRGLADLLRARTAPLHAQAEGSGIVQAILTGRVTRAGYSLFLRNLIPAYCALEAGLARHASHPVVGSLHRPELRRVPALMHDVSRLAGADWADSLPILPAAEAYARRVTEAGGLNPELLLAHVYTRYLGDLGGGQILRSRLLRGAHIEEDCLTFHTFPQVADARTFALQYRAAIDAAGQAARTPARVVDEAVAAFRLNIELSEAVHRSDATTLAHE